MDSMQAFMIGQANRGKEAMVFDWDKAASIIQERQANSASAGLSGDWEWTGGDILKNGLPIPEDETYVYLSSTWAEPMLCINGEMIECYRMESETPGWDSGTYWPESARALLGIQA